MAPILVGADEPRHLSAEHNADLPHRHRGHQPLEALSQPAADRRAATEVEVDDLHLVPPQLAGPIGEGNLQALAFEVLPDLLLGRLAQVHDRLSGQVIGGDLVRKGSRLHGSRLPRIPPRWQRP